MEKCTRCGTTSMVEYRRNPYQWDMYEETVMEWLCPDCYQDIAGDI